MQVYLYIEINLFAAIILLLIYFNIRHKTVNYLTEQKLYMALLILNALILICDTFTWVLDGTNTPVLRLILILCTVVYYILHPIIGMTWSLYVDFQINRNSYRILKMVYPMLIPIIISTLLSILSAFGNFYFYIDKNGIYHRGKFFMLLTAISFFYLVYSIIYIIRNRKRIQKSYFTSFLMFAVPPIIGALLQIAFYGLSMIWTGMTISILIIFINIQNEQMYLDYLTGLYNRRQLDLYLQDMIQKNKLNIAGIMLDLNSFKNINDHFGHNIGDEALKYTSEILKRSFHSHSFISRFGGDEFIVLLEVNNKEDLEKALVKLKENVQQFNATKALPYEINFSIGADLYDCKSMMTNQEFINHIDSLMYREKQSTLQELEVS